MAQRGIWGWVGGRRCCGPRRTRRRAAPRADRTPLTERCYISQADRQASMHVVEVEQQHADEAKSFSISACVAAVVVVKDRVCEITAM